MGVGGIFQPKSIARIQKKSLKDRNLEMRQPQIKYANTQTFFTRPTSEFIPDDLSIKKTLSVGGNKWTSKINARSAS